MRENKIIPTILEECRFDHMWTYKEPIEGIVVVLDNIIEMPLQRNPMQAVDFHFTSATTDTHHTFGGRIVHETGLFMN